MNREDHLSEVNGWREGTCIECGHPFPQRGGYEQRCPLCYKVEKGYKVLWGDQAFLWAQTEILELRMKLEEAKASAPVQKAETGLKGNLLRRVISLCHPDKHGNSERATEVTQELLTLRGAEQPKRRKR